MNEIKKCESCGMPMMKQSDFGGAREDNRYCAHCTYENGNLKPRHEVREGMIAYFIKMKKLERKAAEEFVDRHMARMPAWQD
ncbi:hypothetical protein GF318_00175 [Candidatus Micrarchaeota archaeon]|nr:hypothetical protein [Candidatus Micrarchaeota archaeon]